MIVILIVAVFMLCAALTSVSILLASRLKVVYKSSFFTPLIFFLTFYFTFGYYGIWGEMILSSMLQSLASPELIMKLSEYMNFLGSPFLLVASLMYVRYAREISGRRTTDAFILLYLLINLTVIILLGYFGFTQPQLNLSILTRYYFIALSTLFASMGAYYFIYPGKDKALLQKKDLAGISLSFLGLILIQNLVLLAYDQHLLVALSFILLFFLSGGIGPIYIKYKADLTLLIPKSETSNSFDHFCEQYKISPREKEIIHEICKGLTNQEIADQLFISLQTVKDHNHRIYFKTDCSSRAQLIRKVNEAG